MKYLTSENDIPKGFDLIQTVPMMEDLPRSVELPPTESGQYCESGCTVTWSPHAIHDEGFCAYCGRAMYAINSIEQDENGDFLIYILAENDERE